MKGSVTRMRSSLPGKARGFRGAGRTPLNALPAWERETEAAGVMEGPGESSPRSGVRRGGAPRQPQCITLGRLAPRHFAVRRVNHVWIAQAPLSPPSQGAAACRARGVQVEGYTFR